MTEPQGTIRNRALGNRALPVFPVESDGGRRAGLPIVQAAPAGAPVGEGTGPRIGVITFGCDKNTVDSERMMGALVGHGARITQGAEGAEVVLINTCGFIDRAKEESIQAILEACELKNSGTVRAVVAVGCLVQRYQEELTREIPEVDLFMGLTEMPTLVPELRRRGLLAEATPAGIMEVPLRILATDTPHTSHLKISEGCDHTCAFCAIPTMRGLHRSASLDGLVAEARALGESGVRELNIISQDTTWYGRDLRRRDPSAPLLPELLRGLLDGTAIEWFRLFYMYPSGITTEMIETIASEPRILPYLDMPIQHGADPVLTRMRRPERQVTIREKVARLRAAIPDLTLRTTVIVGFPGETEEDLRTMMEFLEEMRFDRVGVFTYSQEEGTRAADLPGQLPEEVRRERTERVEELARYLSFERNEMLVGSRRRALIDHLLPGDPEFDAVGRLESQAIEVDGATQLLADRELRPGAMYEVEIVDALDHDLVARVLEEVA